MNKTKRESISSISLFIYYLTLLLISKPRGVVTDKISISNKHYYSTSPVIFSPTISVPQIKYDVFVSFRGVDIPKNFLGDFLKALSRKKIAVFSDKNLKTGDEISTLGAIEDSLISLVIFSPNFASSQWCLDELVKIVECRARYGSIVIPVFYHVDPKVVRQQHGAYGDAFAQHEQKYPLSKVLSWRSALKQCADISGLDSSVFS